MNFLNKKYIGIGLVGIVIAGGGWYFWHTQSAPTYQTAAEKDPYVRFDMEAYDAIVKNYWVKVGDYGRFGMPELPELFRLALQKNTGKAETLATSTRAGTAEMLAGAFTNATSTDARRGLALQTAAVVMYNLLPAGRDGLLSKKEEKALRDDVANVNPSTGQVAPSVLSHTMSNTLILSFNKISPTTLQEFAIAINNSSTTPVENLILDMRGNVGGQLSFAQDFTGLFIGGGQYAFDLHHQGDIEVQRTTQQKFDQLARFKHVAILTDAMTQSTAELVTSIMKRFKLATVIGTKTRGWGSVEDTYLLKTVVDPSTSYSLLIVNHLTLRDDNQPIEENGVVPDVDTSIAGWQKRLGQYFDSPSFVRTISTVASEAPLR